MNTSTIAPCGLICSLCYAAIRKKNRCDGCNSNGNKTSYCFQCRIKQCPEKNGREKELCFNCRQFPCKAIKNLEKRYYAKYGESIIANQIRIKEIGKRAFLKENETSWLCKRCGKVLCIHSENCHACNEPNPLHPRNKVEGGHTCN